MYRKQEFIIESLNSEIARLKSLIPNDDDCKSCEFLMDEISKMSCPEFLSKIPNAYMCVNPRPGISRGTQ